MADGVGAAELVDVDMHQVARSLALIANDRRLGIEGGETPEAMPSHGKADGGGRVLQPARDDGAIKALAAAVFDPLAEVVGHAAGTMMEPAGTVARTVLAITVCRSRHLRTVFGPTPCAAAMAVMDQPLARRWIINNRLCGVVWASWWMSIRFSGVAGGVW